MRVRIGAVALTSLIGATILASLAGAATRSSIVREVARSGEWTASFTYVRGRAAFQNYSGLHLTLQKGSQLVLDQPVVSGLHGVNYVQPGAFGGKSVSFRDLNGDGTPELLLALFTGGAHCCLIDQVYNLTPTEPKRTEMDFGDGGAQIKVVDGKTIFQGADHGFDYAFTDYADSASPLQVWAYSNDRFSDVTRSFPSLISKDAASWWKQYRLSIKTHRDVRGVLGAWAADEALLGRAHGAKATLLQIAFSGRLDWGFGGAKGSTYVRNLWSFLAKAGYLR